MLMHLLNNMKASLLCEHIFHGLCIYVLKLSTLRTYYEGIWLYKKTTISKFKISTTHVYKTLKNMAMVIKGFT